MQKNTLLSNVALCLALLGAFGSTKLWGMESPSSGSPSSSSTRIRSLSETGLSSLGTQAETKATTASQLSSLLAEGPRLAYILVREKTKGKKTEEDKKSAEEKFLTGFVKATLQKAKTSSTANDLNVEKNRQAKLLKWKSQLGWWAWGSGIVATTTTLLHCGGLRTISNQVHKLRSSEMSQSDPELAWQYPGLPNKYAEYGIFATLWGACISLFGSRSYLSGQLKNSALKTQELQKKLDTENAQIVSLDADTEVDLGKAENWAIEDSEHPENAPFNNGKHSGKTLAETTDRYIKPDFRKVHYLATHPDLDPKTLLPSPRGILLTANLEEIDITANTMKLSDFKPVEEQELEGYDGRLRQHLTIRKAPQQPRIIFKKDASSSSAPPADGLPLANLNPTPTPPFPTTSSWLSPRSWSLWSPNSWSLIVAIRNWYAGKNSSQNTDSRSSSSSSNGDQQPLAN